VKTVQGVPADFSAREKNKAVRYIGYDQSRFDRVIREFFKGPHRYNQLAAGPLHDAVRRYPHLLSPHVRRFLIQLDKTGNYPAMTRNILRILQLVTVPKSLQGRAVNTGLRILEDTEELVAAKVFAMTMLANIAKAHPGLKSEIRAVIENQYPYASAAYKSRARRVLKTLAY
jgi:hypothetical protein